MKATRTLDYLDIRIRAIKTKGHMRVKTLKDIRRTIFLDHLNPSCPINRVNN